MSMPGIRLGHLAGRLLNIESKAVDSRINEAIKGAKVTLDKMSKVSTPESLEKAKTKIGEALNNAHEASLAGGSKSTKNKLQFATELLGSLKKIAESGDVSSVSKELETVGKYTVESFKSRDLEKIEKQVFKKNKALNLVDTIKLNLYISKNEKNDQKTDAVAKAKKILSQSIELKSPNRSEIYNLTSKAALESDNPKLIEGAVNQLASQTLDNLLSASPESKTELASLLNNAKERVKDNDKVTGHKIEIMLSILDQLVSPDSINYGDMKSNVPINKYSLAPLKSFTLGTYQFNVVDKEKPLNIVQRARLEVLALDKSPNSFVSIFPGWLLGQDTELKERLGQKLLPGEEVASKPTEAAKTQHVVDDDVGSPDTKDVQESRSDDTVSPGTKEVAEMQQNDVSDEGASDATEDDSQSEAASEDAEILNTSSSGQTDDSDHEAKTFGVVLEDGEQLKSESSDFTDNDGSSPRPEVISEGIHTTEALNENGQDGDNTSKADESVSKEVMIDERKKIEAHKPVIAQLKQRIDNQDEEEEANSVNAQKSISFASTLEWNADTNQLVPNPPTKASSDDPPAKSETSPTTAPPRKINFKKEKED